MEPSPPPKRKSAPPKLDFSKAEPEKKADDDNRLSDVLSKLQMSKMNLQAKDFEDISELGSGSGGVVKKSKHNPTGMIMAKKVIQVTTTPDERRLIERELEILKDLDSPSIVKFYGAFLNATEIHICMEHMDVGSFDHIYQKMEKIPEDILGKIAVSVLDGLVYLYKTYKIIHRDMKPSNILLNSKGQVKICDFGVSGVIQDSIKGADTFVGTSYYMSPSRIMNQAYTTRSDSWSLGISLLEMAIGRFPINLKTPDKPTKKVGVFDLVQAVVREPPPKVPDGFSPGFQDFISKCLVKEDDDRPSPAELLDHPYIAQSRAKKIDMSEWAHKVLEK